MSNLAQTLKTLRIKKGISQAAVAEALGITKQSYSHYENDKRCPDYDTLLKLAEFFGTDTDYLLSGSDAAPVSDSRLKFALFGDCEIDDDVLDDVKQLAKLQLELRRSKTQNNTDK